MDPDPDQGGPKTRGSGGSGSGTLVQTGQIHVFQCTNVQLIMKKILYYIYSKFLRTKAQVMEIFFENAQIL